MELKCINIAIVGFGGVGKSVANLVSERADRYRAIYGAEVRVVAACSSNAGIYRPQGIDVSEPLSAGQTGPEFLSSIDANIVVDATPTDFRTGGSGYQYVRRALSAGRHVISISKGALVFDYFGLRSIADRTGAILKVSGATAAALPTIDLIEYNLRGCEVIAVEGILTATANHVLTEMTARQIGLDEAVSNARSAGIAEKDPTFDIGGWDTACKIVILANAGFGLKLSIDDVRVQGLESVTAEQIHDWKQDRVVPKLVGSLKRSGNAVKASVGLQLYPESHVFSQVTGKTKAIRVFTDSMGELLAIGGGAEPKATAAAALKDLEHILALPR